jgi:branched-chain amino acid transport system ATP-binding protein
VLVVKGIHSFYGTSHVLHGVSLTVDNGEVVALLGRNGAGKSTTIKSIMGIVSPRRGEVRFNDRAVTGWAPHRIAHLGVGYVPEDRCIFPDLTVRENLLVGAIQGGKEWTFERVYQLFPALRDFESRMGGRLSGGQQQMLAIARALLVDPRLVLLDEPSEGLAPLVVEHLAESLAKLKAQGMSILLAEQNLEFVRELADRAYVIDKGMIVHESTIDEVLHDEEISARFLAV